MVHPTADQWKVHMVDIYHFACTRKGLNSTGKCSTQPCTATAYRSDLPWHQDEHGTQAEWSRVFSRVFILMGTCKEDLWFLFLSWKCWACKFCQPHLHIILSPPARMHSHPRSLDSSAVERNEAIRVTRLIEKPRVGWEWMTFISLIPVVHKSSSIYIIPFILISEPINIPDFL